MKMKPPHRFLKAITLFATGGALLQTTSCSQQTTEIIATSVAGLATSVVNTFLSIYIADLFGTGGGYGF